MKMKCGPALRDTKNKSPLKTVLIVHLPPESQELTAPVCCWLGYQLLTLGSPLDLCWDVSRVGLRVENSQWQWGCQSQVSSREKKTKQQQKATLS